MAQRKRPTYNKTTRQSARRFFTTAMAAINPRTSDRDSTFSYMLEYVRSRLAFGKGVNKHKLNLLERVAADKEYRTKQAAYIAANPKKARCYIPSVAA